MKKLMVALTAIILFAGCMGQAGRSLDEVPVGDESGKVKQEAICQEAIADMEDAFDAATIKTKIIKTFFADVIDACEGVSVDYVTPIAQLIHTQTNACGCTTSFRIAIEAGLADVVEKRFEEKITFSSSSLCAMPPSCRERVDGEDEYNKYL